MWQLGSIAFPAPWILTALLALPLIWWLLRVTPPAPRRIDFPTIRLLFGLEGSQQTPQSSPLWLILLRLAAVAALILGLAGPLINAGGGMSGSGPVLLVVDDGWAAASNWPGRLAAIESTIDQAERDNRPVALLTTARDRDGRLPAVSGPFKGETVRSVVSALQPKPWPVDRVGSILAMESFSAEGSIPVIWFSNGLGGDNIAEFAARLQQFGSLEVFAPPGNELPTLVFPPKLEFAQLVVTTQRLDAARPKRIRLRGRAVDGRLLIETEALFKAGELQTEAREGGIIEEIRLAAGIAQPTHPSRHQWRDDRGGHRTAGRPLETTSRGLGGEPTTRQGTGAVIRYLLSGTCLIAV